MALDANGNWYPSLPAPASINRACSKKWCVVSGVPSNDVGNDGDLVISQSDGTIYEKVSGVWTAFPGYTGSSGFNNLNGTTSPVGSVTPNYIGQFYLKTPSPFDVWQSTGLTNTSWVKLFEGIT